jgi:hypothetical protein
MCCKLDHGRLEQSYWLGGVHIDLTSLEDGLALMEALGKFHTCMYNFSVESYDVEMCPSFVF